MAKACYPSGVVIFDGTCGFCSRVVTFILRHERGEDLRFSPNTSPFALALLERHNLVGTSKHSIIVVHGGSVLLRSDAVVFICQHLRAPFSLLKHMRWIPRFVRDAGYRAIASIRHLLGARVEMCEQLSPEQQKRILETEQ